MQSIATRACYFENALDDRSPSAKTSAAAVDPRHLQVRRNEGDRVPRMRPWRQPAVWMGGRYASLGNFEVLRIMPALCIVDLNEVTKLGHRLEMVAAGMQPCAPARCLMPPRASAYGASHCWWQASLAMGLARWRIHHPRYLDARSQNCCRDLKLSRPPWRPNPVAVAGASAGGVDDEANAKNARRALFRYFFFVGHVRRRKIVTISTLPGRVIRD